MMSNRADSTGSVYRGRGRGKIFTEITLLILAVIVVIIGTIVIKPSPVIIPQQVIVPPANFCQIQVDTIDQNTFLGVKHVTTSHFDTTGENIGISDGSFAFDTQGTDSNVKCQASEALKAKDSKKAEALWTKALQQQSNDAETSIYLENQVVLDSHLPYITFVVGVTLTGENIGIGHDILQGVYVEQKEYNDSHPGMQVRLLIANYGSQAASASEVTRQIRLAAVADPTIKGMTGIPSSVVAQSMSSVLSTLTFPVVLPTGSNGPQENAANVFHIAPSTESQGSVGATFVEQHCPYYLSGTTQVAYDCPGQNITVFIDPEDAYSNSLGSAFEQKLRSDNVKTVREVSYQAGSTSDIIGKVQNALNTEPFPDLIYFAGTSADASMLLQHLASTGRYTTLRVMGGDALYDLGGYTAGAFRRLDFTAFAYPDEWGYLKLATPIFFQDYKHDFAGGHIGYGYARPENDVILSYDAMSVLLKASDTAGASGGNVFSYQQLENALTSITTAQPFQGVSGRIAFQSDSNPANKAIVILRCDEYGHVQLQRVVGAFK